MKHFIFTILTIFAFSTSAVNLTDSYDVVPRPHKVALKAGRGFSPDNTTVIVCPPSDSALCHLANNLVGYIYEITGQIPPVVAKPTGNKAIVLAVDRKLNISPDPRTCEVGHREGYIAKVTEKRITITGESPAGVAMGIQMIRKALWAAPDFTLTQATVTDFPDMPYRGFMLDVGRHFFTVDEVLDAIDIAALHQLNVFHWHLTEDQGWRIEIKKYPRLTEVGAWRSGTLDAPGGKSNGVPHGGFFTQDEVRRVVEYAAQRQITVIPEIDMPGHMVAALAAYPELGCTKGPYDVEVRYGVFNDVLCVGEGKALKFCCDVLDEIMQLFPSKYIHVGGDECPRIRWENCVHCQEFVHSHGWTDTDTHKKEAMLQSYFMQEIEKHLNANNRRMIGWDEIIEGGVAEDATVMAWTRKDATTHAAKLLHDVVATPIQVTYLSNRSLVANGLDWNLRNIYSYEPIDPSLTPEEAAHVIGMQGCLWTEWVHNFRRLEYLLTPRMAAIGERAWNRTAQGGFDGFYQRLERLKPVYKSLDYQFWQE